MSNLPYSFDLIADIKDENQLNVEVSNLARKLEDLLTLCVEHEVLLSSQTDTSLDILNDAIIGYNYFRTNPLKEGK